MREIVLVVAFLAVGATVAALLNSPGTLGGLILGVIYGAAIAAKK